MYGYEQKGEENLLLREANASVIIFTLGMTNILFRAWRKKLSSGSSGLDLNFKTGDCACIEDLCLKKE